MNIRRIAAVAARRSFVRLRHDHRGHDTTGGREYAGRGLWAEGLMQSRGLAFGLFALVAISAGGCSTYMEATRPDPVDLDQFKPGEPRISVIGQIGTPTSSVKDQDKNCDVYRLYTHGPGTWGKAGIAFGEAAADVFTLGLAEVVTTPAEAVTRDKLHTVLFCYGGDDKLAMVRESDAATAPTVATTPSQGAAPVAQASPSRSMPQASH